MFVAFNFSVCYNFFNEKFKGVNFMQERYMHPFYGEIVYDESLWTGKKIITIGDKELQKVAKNKFMFNDKEVVVKGSLLFGVKLCLENETIEFGKKPAWYEIALSLLPLLFLLVWGNSVTLCSIFPVIGGGLGGALGGLSSFFCLFLVRKMKGVPLKIAFCLGMLVATILAGFLSIAPLLLLN